MGKGYKHAIKKIKKKEANKDRKDVNFPFRQGNAIKKIYYFATIR